MKVYFIRHGESEANVLHVISNRGSLHGLTEKGQQQAFALAAELENTSITRIYTSPLLRAWQTSQILAQALNVSLEQTDALCEYDCGCLEGRSDAEAWAEYAAISDDWLEHRNWERRPAGGESFNDMRARFIPFIDKLIKQPDMGSVALVSHGGLYRCMLPLVVDNLSWSELQKNGLGNAAYFICKTGTQSLTYVRRSKS